MPTLPPDLLPPILVLLRDRLGAACIDGAQEVAGGDTHRAARVETDRGPVFVKWNASDAAPMFDCEVRGLHKLRSADALRIPEPLGVVRTERWAAVAMEWIQPDRPTAAVAERLGRGLARLHAVRAPAYGLDHDNFIGRLPQPNAPSPSWVEFYRRPRLRFQIDLAHRSGRMDAGRLRRL